MKKYKVIYHIGSKPTLKTKVKRGIVSVDNADIFLHSKSENFTMSFNNIKGVSLFMLNGLGSMLEIQQEENTIFLSVVRFCIGQFFIGNFVGTRKLLSRIRHCNNLKDND